MMAKVEVNGAQAHPVYQVGRGGGQCGGSGVEGVAQDHTAYQVGMRGGQCGGTVGMGGSCAWLWPPSLHTLTSH